MSRVGDKIKTIRNQKGMSTKKFAKKLGVSEKFINEVEMGKKIMNESLMDKASKVLGSDLNDLTMYHEEKEEENIMSEKFTPSKKVQQKTVDVWNDALSSILKAIPVYDYSLNKVIDKRKLPVISNKIEGYAQDKVLFIEIQDDDMVGFRISKGDIAFGHKIKDLPNNSICLVEYNNERKIRQIKKLDSNKVLLISNRGSLMTETAEIKRIKPLVKLDKVEIKL
ncbi:S24 family peptidase [Haloimpatiens sp. FM7330]|uniref:S24 family peptidase n=1 Tax=Haloimpatiens sp. FM7330 TaxID=3298610 RepID=UPI003624B8BB